MIVNTRKGIAMSMSHDCILRFNERTLSTHDGMGALASPIFNMGEEPHTKENPEGGLW